MKKVTELHIYKKIGKWPGEWWDMGKNKKETLALFKNRYDKEAFRLVFVTMVPYKEDEND